jgi:hypothetical protein
MNAHAAPQSDAARMLLVAYEEIKQGPAHPEDALEATRLASLALAPIAIISRMKAVAQRNGVGWRPSRLRYFANPIADLVKEQPVEVVYPKPYLLPTDPEDPEIPLTAEQRTEWARRLRQVTRERLTHGR